MRSESDGPAGEAEAAGLLEALTSDDEAARRQAIQGAVQLGERAVPLLPELQRLAREDPSVEIRFLCTRALDAIAQAAGPSRQAPGARKSTGSTRLLALEPAETLAVKLESPDVNLRASALRACALKQDRTVLPALLERASPERELDPELRALACRVTGILGGGATLDAIGRFGDDPDARVRLTAVEVFAQLPSVTSFGYVAVALMDADERVVRGAATVLRTLGPLNIPRLGQAMLRAQEVRFRRAAVHLLRATALPAAVPLLASTLSDPDPAVREAAQAALVQLAARGIAGAAEAVPAGAPPATPLSGSVPLVAAPAPPPEAPPRPALPLDDIASADPRERRRAAATLAGLDAPDESVVPQLLQRVKLETDASTSGHLIRAVVMAKGRGALEAVLPMLTDRQSVVRASAVDALGQIGTPEAIDAAVPLLADPDPQVVGRAVLTLRLHRKIDISKIIDDLAVRPDPRFRRVAVSTASLLGDERFRAVLGRLAEDPDAETARLAAAALTLLERQRGGEAVTLPPTAPARSRSGAWRLASALPAAGPGSLGALRLLAESPALQRGLLAGALAFCALGAAVLLRSEPARTIAPGGHGAPAAQLAEVLAAPDLAPFAGRAVHWRGTLREISAAHDRLVLEQDGQRFEARFSGPALRAVPPGTALEVDGVVQERAAGLVVLTGHAVRIASMYSQGF